MTVVTVVWLTTVKLLLSLSSFKVKTLSRQLTDRIFDITQKNDQVKFV